jgi:exoribonuclease-2
MNILFEDEGQIRAASVLADNQTSLQVEMPHGRRVKVKASSVLLRFPDPAAGPVTEAARALASELDPDFLWEVSGEAEFGFEDLAREYYGHPPKPAEAAAVAMKLHDSPMHFYKKGRGRYRPAPSDALAAAKAGAERKRREKEQVAGWAAQLARFEFPQEMHPKLGMLLHAPDRSSLEWKALDEAARTAGLSALKLLDRCGALPSPDVLHLGAFLAEHFPRGTGFPPTATAAFESDLPLGERHAFSIDDASTTEIDDAFSVEFRHDGAVRVGIHIAAPALGIAADSELDRIAATRLSTVYFPGDKITMLPDWAIHTFTLGEARDCPTLSLYMTVDPGSFEIRSAETRLERVTIAANLRHDELEIEFNESTIGNAGAPDYPFRREIEFLYRFAGALAAIRGKGDEDTGRVDYTFRVTDGKVDIRERKRGTPIDTVVSELMILVNARWGTWLRDASAVGIYRVQANGKVRMTTAPGPHQGLGVENYAWSSSPLRRYVDLVNQRQLAALATGEAPPYRPGDERVFSAMRAFELAYDAYAMFQRHMERFWCMRWLIQEDVRGVAGQVVRDNLVRIARLPLVIRVPSMPDLAPGTGVRLTIAAVDLLEMQVEAGYAGEAETVAAGG